ATLTSPAGQSVWVALRLDAADAPAAAAARGGGLAGVHRALAAAVGRVQKTLRAAGLPYYRVLTGDELADAVASVGGLGDSGRAAASAGEQWSLWQGPDAAHVCFRLSGVPTYSLSHLVAGLSQCAVLSFTVTVLLHARGGELAVDALLRVAVAEQAVAVAVGLVASLASRIGLEVTRLDGAPGRAAGRRVVVAGGRARHAVRAGGDAARRRARPSGLRRRPHRPGIVLIAALPVQGAPQPLLGRRADHEQAGPGAAQLARQLGHGDLLDVAGHQQLRFERVEHTVPVRPPEQVLERERVVPVGRGAGVALAQLQSDRDLRTGALVAADQPLTAVQQQ